MSLIVVALITFTAVTTDWGAAAEVTVISLQALSQVLFTDYALPFEILSLLLLAAIIGAIFLARRPEEDEQGELMGADRLPGRLGAAVRDRRVRLPGPTQRDPDADLHRADAERGQPQPGRLQRLPADPGNIGGVFSLLVMAVAAAEATVGLALVIAIIRTRQTPEVDEYSDLKE